MNREAKITLFAIVSLAVLVSVVWYRQYCFRKAQEAGVNPFESRAMSYDDADSGHGTVINTITALHQADAPVQADGGSGSSVQAPADNTPQDDDTSDANLQTPPGSSSEDPGAPVDDAPEDAITSGGAAAEPIIHVVQPGESLWTISRTHFGDATHRLAIFEANRDKLSSPDRVLAGQKLLIPTQAAPAPEDAEPAQAAPAERTHTVVRGDTLMGLSRKFYGTPAKAKSIFEANRDKLGDPNVLPVGIELRIP